MAVYFLPKSRMKKFMARTDHAADVLFIDVSNKSTQEWNVLAPIFNHGNIPVPGMAGKVSMTVEGIWEGLKKYKEEEPNLALFESEKPKRRRLADAVKLEGYLYGTEILKDEVDARRKIFIPAYLWMLKNCPQAREKFEALAELSKKHTLHVFDGEENGNPNDPRPFAYAALLTELVRDAAKNKTAALV